MGSRFLSPPRDLRHLLALLALLLGLGEFADAFFISFWEGAAVFSVLFLAAMLWIRRGGIGGPILVGALCVFELQSFPTWHRHGVGNWISQIAFVVVAAAGLLLALAVLKQSYRIRRAKASAARMAALLSLLVLVSAGAALAGSGGVGTVSITEHFPGLVLVPPIMIYAADGPGLRRAYDRAMARDVQRLAVFTRDLFSTPHDQANRAALATVPADALDLSDIAVHADRKTVDKTLDKLRPHP
jgi:hypothetical protein